MTNHAPHRVASRWLVGALLVTALGALAAAAPPTAEAQGRGRSGGRVRIGTPHTGSRPLQLDLHLGFAWYGRGLATGVRFGIPIVENGFVPSINNAVYINFGMDLYFIEYRYGCYDNMGRARGDCRGTGIGFPVTMHWEFYFSEHWTAFGEVGLNPFIAPGYLDGDRYRWDGRHWFIVAVGGRYMFNDAVALTLRVGSPYAAFGVSFFF